MRGPNRTGILQPNLFPNHDGVVHTIRVANSHKGGVAHRGGVRKYHPIKKDVLIKLREHKRPGVFFTSMIDLYRLPADFPDKQNNNLNPQYPIDFTKLLEKAFGNDINDKRFVPYLQLYEYETLLFANIESFRYSFEDCDDQIKQLQKIVDSVQSIEHINDGPQTAPSKRVINIFPEYEGLKTTAGVDIAEYTGMRVLQEKCSHFNHWIQTLKGLWPEQK